MKKIVSLLMPLMAISLLASCGSNKPTIASDVVILKSANADQTLAFTFDEDDSFESIDWGDGTIDSNFNHTYKATSETKEYHISIKEPKLFNFGLDVAHCTARYNITSITIPSGVTLIGDYAFTGCSSLTSINIPNSVTLIGLVAFSACSSLTSITIPNSVIYIGSGAFTGCASLQYNKFDNGLYLGNETNNYYALIKPKDLNISSCNIADSCKIIVDSAFAGCSSLTSINIPNSVTSIGDSAFTGCSALTSVNIPNSVTSIGYGAFDGTSLQYNKFDNGLYLGNETNNYYALIKPKDLNISSCNIADSCKIIVNFAFGYCSKLISITIPSGVTSIGGGAFTGCSSLALVNIPNSVTSIGGGAFDGCSSLCLIVVDNGNQKFDSRNNCNAIIETSSNKLIVGCKNSIIPNSVTAIGNSAFDGCSELTSINISDSVTSIGDWAFAGCSKLTSFTIPSGVTSIGDSAFTGCSSLALVNIPNSVTSIGGNAFCSCSSLGSIVVDNGNQKFDSRNNCNAIIKTSSNKLIVGCKNSIIPNSVTSIGNFAFYGCSKLTSINIPNSVTSIGSYAFSGCSSLTSINIPNSVTSIGDYAFYYCSSLTSINIPNSVTSIGVCAFDSCTSLSSINIPNSVTSIGNFAFYGCSKLTSINIPNSVTSIGSYAFSGCSSLTSINIPNSVTSIGDYAFAGCSSLTSVDLSNVDHIIIAGTNIFSWCTALTKIKVKSVLLEQYKTADGWKDYADKIVAA